MTALDGGADPDPLVACYSALLARPYMHGHGKKRSFRTFLTHHTFLDTETTRILSHSHLSHSTPNHVCIHSLAVALERDLCVFLEFFLYDVSIQA